jgi:hypothetical protein
MKKGGGLGEEKTLKERALEIQRTVYRYTLQTA